MLARETSVVDGEEHGLVHRQGLYFIRGVADRDTGLFLLDTGAPGLILHRAAAAAPGVQQAAIEGATGTVAAYRLYVSEFSIANLLQRSVPAIGIDLTAARKLLGEDLIGIIGYGQLHDASAHVDFRRRTIRFGESRTSREHNPAEAAGQRVYDFAFQAHLPTVRIGVGDDAYNLAFDTGSEVNVFDESILPELGESIRGRPSFKDVSGVDAHVERAPYALVRLALLDEDRYSNRPFAFLDLEGFRQNLPELDGILGVGFWGADAIVIDYPAREITTYARGSE